MRFLVHGSIAYDFIIHSEGSFADGLNGQDIQKLSVGFFANELSKHHGGTATNISWNLRILGLQPVVVGTVGSDGRELIDVLAAQQINVSLIEQKKEWLTATAFVATDNDGRQITFFHPGADAHGKLPSNESLKGVDLAIISPRDHVLMQQAAVQCHTLGIPYIFDPGQQSLAFSRDELRRAVTGAKCLVVNAYEWQLATEKMEWEAADILRVCDMLVITQGDEGLTLHTIDDTVHVPACPINKFINPTGAGDALRAGLLVGLQSGWSLRDIGRLGAVMGSFPVEQKGTLVNDIGLNYVRARAKEAYGEELPRF